MNIWPMFVTRNSFQGRRKRVPFTGAPFWVISMRAFQLLSGIYWPFLIVPPSSMQLRRILFSLNSRRTCLLRVDEKQWNTDRKCPDKYRLFLEYLSRYYFTMQLDLLLLQYLGTLVAAGLLHCFRGFTTETLGCSNLKQDLRKKRFIKKCMNSTLKIFLTAFN